ncbi:hypothetical protein ACA910_014054 [Epithemia clementina (nom. ined.)]
MDTFVGGSDDEDDGPPILVNVDEENSKISDPTALAKESTVEETTTNKTNTTKKEPLPVNETSKATSATPVKDDTDDQRLGSCPVTILSGFLGSGKTTLIQYILKSPNHGKRIAVIENEYGEGLAIESLIAREGIDDNNKSSSLMDLIELPNGCLCCTVKDSLVVTLENLLTKRQDLDYILIECSGMANPGPIASLFWLDDALDSRLRLDGIVTLCDAVYITQQLETTLEASQQIAYADRILINKIDLIAASNNKGENDEVQRITRLIRQFHPTAPIQCTSYANVPDLDWILDAHCFDGERVFGQLAAATSSLSVQSMTKEENDEGKTVCSICDHDIHQDGPGHSHEHHHHHHDENVQHTHTQHVSTVALVKVGSVDRKRMDQWLDSIVVEGVGVGAKTTSPNTAGALSSNRHLEQNEQQQQQSIFRIKGILSLYQTPESADYDAQYCCADNQGLDRRRFIVQGVYDLWEIHPSSSSLWTDAVDNGAPEERCCKLVVIGRFLNQSALQSGFEACFIS